MQNLKNAEILAPAGNMEMLVAAVRSGADAIYLGSEEFSARRNAQNFSLSELQEAIKYCHIRAVRVYLALNILIKESELEDAYRLAQCAYNMGIDGIIVQDLGLARILHENIPDLKLHASTQMSVLSPAALKPLKQLGICQVVAGREMSKKELAALCEEAKKLDMVVEVFVHGALCMSVSGQCLLSAFLGSRSGNRGLCAGPCRLPFKVEKGTGYDLSLKDLSLLEYLSELYEMGVGSFKIEGRMKRPEYVAAATFACKQALESGFVEEKLSSTLKNVFSRSGFTAGYYEAKLDKDMFGIRTKDDVLSADKAFPYLHEIYRNERQNVPVSVKAQILNGKPISLTLTDNDGNAVTVTGDLPQAAQNKPLTYENALKNLCKFGGTPYYDVGGGLQLDDGLFVPAGELNALRRKACEKLDELRGNILPKPDFSEYKSVKTGVSDPVIPNIVARFENAAQIPENVSDLSAIILPLEENPDNVCHLSLPLIVDIPRAISDEKAILNRLKIFKQKGFVAALCGNLSAISLAKQAGLTAIADTGLNLTNIEALNTAEKLGINSAVLSAELTLEEIKGLYHPIKKGIVAYGHLPLMLFRNCPLKNGKSCSECDKKGVISDRLGMNFPIRCRNGYSEMLNSLPIWLADRSPEIENIDFIVLYFTRETPERVEEVIKAYKNGSSSSEKYTRGLYYRGTI